jgi:hypothetical protein
MGGQIRRLLQLQRMQRVAMAADRRNTLVLRGPAMQWLLSTGEDEAPPYDRYANSTKSAHFPCQETSVSRVVGSDGEQRRWVYGRGASPVRQGGETNDRSARNLLVPVAGRTGRRATYPPRGGAYSHFGCRIDCPRGHRGKPYGSTAAPGRGAPFGRRKAAAALARDLQAGPGPAARGRHVAGPRFAAKRPFHGARTSPCGASAPRVALSLPRLDSTRRRLLRAGCPSHPSREVAASRVPVGGSASQRTVCAMAIHVRHKRKFRDFHSGQAATPHSGPHLV